MACPTAQSRNQTLEDLVLDYSRPLAPVATSLAPKGSPVVPLKAILFDVYGTLFISKAGDIGGAREEADARIDAINDLCRRYGVTTSVETLLDQFFGGIERDKKSRSDAGTACPEVVIEDIWEQVLGIDDGNLLQRFALEFELIVNPVYPMPGLAYVLSSLNKRGLIMGIISNAQFYTPLLFSAHLGMSLENVGFSGELLFFSYELGYGKPSEGGFLSAATVLRERGVEPEETLYLGNDMLKDIFPAKAARFQTALFAGDSRSLNLREQDERCRGLEPDLIVTELAQLLDCT